jgi:hypothetical protein
MSKEACDNLKKRIYDQHLKSTNVMPKRETMRKIEKQAEDIARRTDRRDGSKR